MIFINNTPRGAVKIIAKTVVARINSPLSTPAAKGIPPIAA